MGHWNDFFYGPSEQDCQNVAIVHDVGLIQRWPYLLLVTLVAIFSGVEVESLDRFSVKHWRTLRPSISLDPGPLRRCLDG
jgi:hypothetical protein